MVVFLPSPQSFSSETSSQSIFLSHTKLFGMHFIPSQLNSSFEHTSQPYSSSYFGQSNTPLHLQEKKMDEDRKFLRLRL